MMPRRDNKGGGNRTWKSGGGRETKYYFEHDDRVADSNRRVSFKHGNSNRLGKNNSRKLNLAIRTHLEDDDVDMGGTGSSGRDRGGTFPGRGHGGGSRGYSNRKSSGRSRSPVPLQNRKRFSENNFSWFRVHIPYGSHYSKDYICKIIMSHISPDTFVPICYQVQGIDSSFFVEDSKVAEKILNADKRITTHKGFKLLIKVKPAFPNVELNTEFKAKIKTAMVKRYNASTKAVTLRRFHTDPELIDNYTVALFRPNLLVAVINILAENVPELAALDLSENKLYSLDHLSVLSEKFPNLKILHIGKNRVRDINQLNFIQSLKLEELVLDGNPVCDKFKDQSVYISEVRKRFPKVVKLDGVDLPPPILFDVSEDEFKIPPSKPSFAVQVDGMAVAKTFLEQYYSIYDSDNRQSLIGAYYENACFSLTCGFPPGQSSASGPKLTAYFSESRNLFRVKDAVRRQKHMYHGNLDVVSFLSKLPKTQHDPHSFVLDVPICTPQIMTMSVTGLFLEPGPGRNQPLRSFHRAFVIIPYGGGFCIINEMLFVTNATEEQAKVAFKRSDAASPTPVVAQSASAATAGPSMSVPPASALVMSMTGGQATSPVPSTSLVSVTPTPVTGEVTVDLSPQAALIDENTKLQMVEAFALQSGMNKKWARKCLDETHWSYEQAATAFQHLNSQGSIPAEAFIK